VALYSAANDARFVYQLNCEGKNQNAVKMYTHQYKSLRGLKAKASSFSNFFKKKHYSVAE